VARLLELGVPSYLVTTTLVAVLAQRLVRTLCPHCKASDGSVDGAVWTDLVAPWRSAPPESVYRPVGCLECRRTGYLGRTGLVELLQVTDATKQLITAGADVGRLRQQAARDGLRSLRVSGAEKIAAGLTTLEEVLKAAPPFTT